MEIELFSNVVSEEDTVEVEVEVDAENVSL